MNTMNILFPALFFVFAMTGIIVSPETPLESGVFKIGFIPEEGKSSGYIDCEAVTPGGATWWSINGVWTQYPYGPFEN